MDLLNIMVLLSIKNQAGPAQDPWPPQAKTKPVWPRTLGPPSQIQAGPARTLGPPSQTQAGPARTLGPPSQNQAGPAQKPLAPQATN